MNKKILIFLLLVVVAPQIVRGAEVTQEILNRLGFYETSQETLLGSDATWKCGVIDEKIIRYKVSGDILGYTDSNEWFRLITPMSTQLPVTAFGIFLGEKGAIRRQVTVMRQCSSEQEQTFNENVNSRQRTDDVAPQTREQVITTKQVKKPAEVVVSTMPVEKPVQKPTKTTGASVQTRTSAENNVDVLNIASVWQLMSIYQEQTGE
jgi:hypothetical protein